MKPYVTRANIKSKAEQWIKYVAPYNRDHLKIKRRKAALLVIDMQEFFLDPESPTFTCGGHAILPGVGKLLEAFRNAKLPVIFTKHVHDPNGTDAGIMAWWWEGMCLEGTPESEITGELSPLPREKIVLKHRYSSFYNTDLETVLRCLKVEDLVISGIMTNMCCESTARDAYYRDYRVFFPTDGTGTVSEEMHLASLLNLAFGFASVTTVDRIIKDIYK